MKTNKLNKGFTLFELLISITVLSIVSAATISGAYAIFANRNQKKYNEDAEGIVEAYHSWFSDNVAKNRSLSAEQCLYNFIVDESGIKSYNYDNLKFNYYFESEPQVVDGVSKYYVNLLFSNDNYSCSIPLEVSKLSSDIEKGHLTYSDKATPTLYDSNAKLLSALNKKDYELALGVYNNKIGRKVSELIINHTADGGYKENLYVRNGKSITTSVFDFTEYAINGVYGSITLQKLPDKTDVAQPRTVSYAISKDMVPVDVIEDVKVDGISTDSVVVVYGNPYEYSFDDQNLPEVGTTGCVVRYNVKEQPMAVDYTSYRTRYDRYTYVGIAYNDFNDNYRTIGTFGDWSEYTRGTPRTNGAANYSKNVVESFDTLEEANTFINSVKYTSVLTGNTYNIYSNYDTDEVLDNQTKTGGYTGKISNKGSWWDWGIHYYCDREYKETDTKTYTYDSLTFEKDSFAIFVGTTTISSAYTVPKDFKFYLDYNFKNITSSTISDNSVDAITLYNRDYVNGHYQTHKEYNRLTITEGASLDVSAGYLKVGGLMKPSDTSNSKDNVGAYSVIENNGTIYLGNGGLEVLGYIEGSGVIKAKDGVNTHVWERSEILDYVCQSNSNANFTSLEYGAPTADNSAFQKAVAIGWGNYFNLKEAATKKSYSQPMFSKYDSSAIKCRLDLKHNDKYTQKFFANYGSQYIIDYNLFGEKYDYGYFDEKITAKLASSIFQIESGTLTKNVSSDNKMIFETSDAKVVNNENYYYKVFFTDDSNYFGVCGSYAPTPLFNTSFIFNGTSSLAINASDFWLLPSSSMSFNDNASLTFGSANVKGYCDNALVKKEYTAHGSLALLNGNDFSYYSGINSTLTFESLANSTIKFNGDAKNNGNLYTYSYQLSYLNDWHGTLNKSGTLTTSAAFH